MSDRKQNARHGRRGARLGTTVEVSRRLRGERRHSDSESTDQSRRQKVERLRSNYRP